MRGDALVYALLLTGCLLGPKAKPAEVRYFSPEAAATSPVIAPIAQDIPPSADAPKLRLGRIASSSYLRSKIVYRTSDVELGVYEDRRWTENPEAYARRSLERALFERGSLVQAVGGGAPTLEAELVAFEEVRQGGVHAGRVAIEYSLHDQREVLASGRVSAEQLAAGESMGAVVQAIGAALEQATTEVAQVVEAKLGKEAR